MIRLFLVFTYIWQEDVANIPKVAGVPCNVNGPGNNMASKRNLLTNHFSITIHLLLQFKSNFLWGKDIVEWKIQNLACCFNQDFAKGRGKLNFNINFNNNSLQVFMHKILFKKISREKCSLNKILDLNWGLWAPGRTIVHVLQNLDNFMTKQKSLSKIFD